jgi:hypothetical protein
MKMKMRMKKHSKLSNTTKKAPPMKATHKIKRRSNTMKGGKVEIPQNIRDIVEIPQNIRDIVDRINNPSNTSNTSLDISNNNIDYIGLNYIIENALKNNNTITTLNLSNNKIGSKGADYLSEVLKINTTLLDINISNNNIKDEGAQAIAKALKINKTVKNIDITENYITKVDLLTFNKYNSLCHVLSNKSRLNIIILPQKIYRKTIISNESRTRLNNMSSHLLNYKLNVLCADSGACLAFGKYSDVIKKYFDNFTSFKYVDPTMKVKLIGDTSKNGFINEIKYIKTVEPDKYESYAILKSSVNQKSDNLMYEYQVGKFINYLNTVYPCFLETYGLYKYKDETTWKKYQSSTLSESKDLKTDLEQINSIDYTIACKESKFISILIQHLKGVKSLHDMVVNNNDFVNNDLIYSLFQIYIPLCTVRDYFTHYDLHAHNVQMYEPKKDHYIEFHYHFTNSDILDTPTPTIISFKSSYISKILDYGRSYFNFSRTFFTQSKEADDSNSEKIHQQICNNESCNQCGKYNGFHYLNKDAAQNKTNGPNYITSKKNNISHDLRTIHILKTIRKKHIVTIPLFDFINKVIYSEKYGTEEKPNSELPDKIANIKDLAIVLSKKIMDLNLKTQNESFYSSKNKLGDLHIYVDEFKPMEFIPYKPNKN